MSNATRWRKRPVEVEAVRWTGRNYDEIAEFTGRVGFVVISREDRGDDPKMTAQVFDKLHSTWVRVYDGQWIVKGIRGEFYPVASDVFEATYEPAAAAGDPVTRLLALPLLPGDDPGASTVRGYLTALLAGLWRDGAAFDAACPFKDDERRPDPHSDFRHDLYEVLSAHGVIDGDFVDGEAADALILAAIERLGQ